MRGEIFTVNELISELEKYDGSAEVVIDKGCIADILNVFQAKNGNVIINVD